jgi:hypothetical protein
MGYTGWISRDWSGLWGPPAGGFRACGGLSSPAFRSPQPGGCCLRSREQPRRARGDGRGRGTGTSGEGRARAGRGGPWNVRAAAPALRVPGGSGFARDPRKALGSPNAWISRVKFNGELNFNSPILLKPGSPPIGSPSGYTCPSSRLKRSCSSC